MVQPLINMKPTLKESQLIEGLAWKLFTLFTAVIAIGSFVFAAHKPEYRQPTANIVTRSMNTGIQISQYRDAFVSYSVQITSNLTLTGGQSGTVLLQTSPNNSTWTTIATQVNNSTGTLTIGLNTSNVQSGSLTGFVPMGYYVRMSSSGTSAFSWQSGIEVLL